MIICSTVAYAPPRSPTRIPALRVPRDPFPLSFLQSALKVSYLVPLTLEYLFLSADLSSLFPDMLPAFLLGRKRRNTEVGSSSSPVEVPDEEAMTGSAPSTPCLDSAITGAPLQMVHASLEKKKRRKKKVEKGSSPSSQAAGGAEVKTPEVTVDSGELIPTRQIGEVKDLDLPFRTDPTSGSIKTLMHKIGRASSDYALRGCVQDRPACH